MMGHSDVEHVIFLMLSGRHDIHGLNNHACEVA
jgi:hypothetical protein